MNFEWNGGTLKMQPTDRAEPRTPMSMPNKIHANSQIVRVKVVFDSARWPLHGST